jgi:hypothetical protein
MLATATAASLLGLLAAANVTIGVLALPDEYRFWILWGG